MAAPSPTTRSAVTNGKALFVWDGVDGRSAYARRFRDVLVQLLEDVGGAEHLSEGQRQLARRTAMVTVEAERMEAEAVSGKPLDLDGYAKCSAELRKLLMMQGLRREAKLVNPPSPTLEQRAREFYGADA